MFTVCLLKDAWVAHHVLLAVVVPDWSSLGPGPCVLPWEAQCLNWAWHRPPRGSGDLLNVGSCGGQGFSILWGGDPWLPSSALHSVNMRPHLHDGSAGFCVPSLGEGGATWQGAGGPMAPTVLRAVLADQAGSRSLCLIKITPVRGRQISPCGPFWSRKMWGLLMGGQSRLLCGCEQVTQPL